MNDERWTENSLPYSPSFIPRSSHHSAFAEAFELCVGEAARARVEQELGGRGGEERADAREREEAAVRRRPELRARVGGALTEAAARAVVAGHGLPEIVAASGRDGLVGLLLLVGVARDVPVGQLRRELVA